MRAVASEEFEVVVVGAGPAGLASAATLGSYGVETLVVERRLVTLDAAAGDTASTGDDGVAPPLGPRGARRWERSIDVEWRAWA